MGIKKYREQYEADLAKASDAASHTVMEYAADRLGEASGGAAEKAKAVADTHLTVDNLGEQIEQLIAILLKKGESVAVRNAALNQLMTAEFFGPAYEPYRIKVEEAKRTVATDKSTTLRHSALQNLAMNNDDYARDLLTKSLESEGEEIVDNATAIRLLGFDDHGSVVKIAKRIFEKLDDKAKQEAVRVMVGDSDSTGLLSTIMADKSHGDELRKLCAVVLQKTDQSEFMKSALKVVKDIHEDPKLQAAYINTAKVQFAEMGDEIEGAAKESIKDLAKQVKTLRKQTRSRILKGIARKYISKADKL